VNVYMKVWISLLKFSVDSVSNEYFPLGRTEKHKKVLILLKYIWRPWELSPELLLFDLCLLFKNQLLKLYGRYRKIHIFSRNCSNESSSLSDEPVRFMSWISAACLRSYLTISCCESQKNSYMCTQFEYLDMEKWGSFAILFSMSQNFNNLLDLSQIFT
jgi:hypothetical protein